MIFSCSSILESLVDFLPGGVVYASGLRLLLRRRGCDDELINNTTYFLMNPSALHFSSHIVSLLIVLVSRKIKIILIAMFFSTQLLVLNPFFIYIRE